MRNDFRCRLDPRRLFNFSLWSYLLFAGEVSLSQSADLSGYRKIWYADPKTVTEAQRYNAGTNLQVFYHRSNYDSMLIISREMASYGVQTGNKHWIASGWNKIGKYHYQTGNIDSAIASYRYTLVNIVNDTNNLRAITYGNMGLAWGNINKLDSAIYYLKLAIEINQQDEYNPEIMVFYGNLGVCYELQGKYLDALDCYRMGYKGANPKTKYISALKIGSVYKKFGLTEEANALFKEALVTSQKLSDPASVIKAYAGLVGTSINLNEVQSTLAKGMHLADSLKLYKPALMLLSNASKVFLDSVDLERAAFCIDRSLGLLKNIKESNTQQEMTLALAQLRYLQGRYAESLQLCRELRPILEHNNTSEQLFLLYTTLSNDFDALGRADSAFYFLKKKEQMETMLHNATITSAFLRAYLSNQTEMEKKVLLVAKENAELIAKASEEKLNRNLLISGIVILLLLSAMTVYYTSYRQKSKIAAKLKELNQQLRLKQDKLQFANTKLKRFSGIVSHDILNNLDLLLSAGNVLVGNSYKPESLRQYYEMSQQSSRQLKAYCLDLLETAQKETRAAELNDPMPIVKRTLRSMEAGILEKKLQVMLSPLSPTSLPVSVIEQLFYNLTSNTLRYGATASNPILYIGEQRPNGKLQWIIEDNGPGIPVAQRESIFESAKSRTPVNGEGYHVGLSLLRLNLRDYYADIRIEDAATGGARWIIEFQD